MRKFESGAYLIRLIEEDHQENSSCICEGICDTDSCPTAGVRIISDGLSQVCGEGLDI